MFRKDTFLSILSKLAYLVFEALQNAAFHQGLPCYMLHQIMAPQFYANFLKLISSVMQSSISVIKI